MSTYSPYSVAEHAVTLLMALNENNSRSKLMQMGDYRLDHLVGLAWKKQSGLLELENRCRFRKNHAWFWLPNSSL
jgi:lactate dehydrogenase-like 2-hydroxyacid dehydrogenase